MQVGEDEYDGSPRYEPGRPHYYEGGYYGGQAIPGGWYATPFWQTLLMGSLMSGSGRRGYGYGGRSGGFGGGVFGGGGSAAVSAAASAAASAGGVAAAVGGWSGSSGGGWGRGWRRPASRRWRWLVIYVYNGGGVLPGLLLLALFFLLPLLLLRSAVRRSTSYAGPAAAAYRQPGGRLGRAARAGAAAGRHRLTSSRCATGSATTCGRSTRAPTRCRGRRSPTPPSG